MFDRKAYMKEYMIKYREDHKQQIQTYQREYREDHKQQIQASQREYRETHREQIKKYRQQYYLSHKEKAIQYSIQYWKKNMKREYVGYGGVCVCFRCGKEGYKQYYRIVNMKTGTRFGLYTVVKHQHSENGKTIYDGNCYIGMGML